MSSSIFSEAILAFTDEINENMCNIEELACKIREIAEKSAGSLRLGLIAFSLDTPKNSYEPEGLVKEGNYYAYPGGYENSGVVKDYTTGDGGKFKLSLMPRKGEKWDDDEKRLIGVLAKTIYIISGRARMLSLMNKSFYTDSLTGAANTTSVTRFGGMLFAQKRLAEYAGVFINIKNFKYINQVFGSRQGDLVLRKFAQAMMKFTADSGMFSRLGGDNFFLLIKKDRMDELRSFTNELSIPIGEGPEIRNADIRIRMGICFAGPEDTVSDLLNKSSIAINAARNGGMMDEAEFTQQMLEMTMHRKKISTLFPKALENSEFTVYYQPKISLSDNKLCGCEALSRWIREGKVVPPMEYIPVLEHEGSICRLDLYIFKKVCEDINRWLSMGLTPVRVSVNFSKLHLQNSNLADEVMEIIGKYNIDPEYIEIELTEMTGAEDFTALNAFVQKMKSAGIATSIDDFGTGYSSLNLLKDLDVDVIKLDKSFFTNIGNENEGRATDRIVVRNIVRMVNELDMETVSEGVETHTQAEFLREIDCNTAQGFLFDRPLPRDEYEKRLSDSEHYKNMG